MDCRSTVVAILERREYTGCTVNFKTYTNSIWDKKQRDNPIEKQAIFPNAHERIIDDDVFEKVQEIRSSVSKSWNDWFSSTFKRLWGISCDTRIIFARSWRDSSAWKAVSKSASAESVWKVWGDRIFEKCGIGRDEGGDGGKTLEIRGKRRLSARDGGANYQQS